MDPTLSIARPLSIAHTHDHTPALYGRSMERPLSMTRPLSMDRPLSIARPPYLRSITQGII